MNLSLINGLFEISIICCTPGKHKLKQAGVECEKCDWYGENVKITDNRKRNIITTTSTQQYQNKQQYAKAGLSMFLFLVFLFLSHTFAILVSA